LAGAAKGWVWLAVSVMLSGCVVPLGEWRGEVAKAKAEYQHTRTEAQERANYTACVNQGAMPGSAENLACQLEMIKKEQDADKAQTSP